METIKECFEIIKMELILLSYWRRKMRLIKYACRMGDYVKDHQAKFKTTEAKEKWCEMRRICEMEAKNN